VLGAAATLDDDFAGTEIADVERCAELVDLVMRERSNGGLWLLNDCGMRTLGPFLRRTMPILRRQARHSAS
jgi:hypothetical protein